MNSTTGKKKKKQGKTESEKVSINIVQANLQKAKLAQTEISRKINKYNKANEEFIVFVQEPMVANNKAVWQPNSCKKFGIENNPRTLIYTDKNRQAWFMESLSNRDLTVVQTKIYNKSVLIVSAYLDIKWAIVISPALNKAMQYAEDNNLGVILAADTNCHSSIFGPDTNKRGEQLEIFVAKFKLNVENNSHTPTYESRGAKTCIDITLTTRLAVTVKNWTVNRDFNGSDHNNIEYTVETDLIQLPEQWKWKDADWILFGKLMERTTPVIQEVPITQKVCDSLVNDFYNTIYAAMGQAIPKIKPKIIDNNNPWWTQELQNQRKKLNKLYKRKINKTHKHSTEQYNAYRNEYRKNVEKARNKSWEDYKEKIGSIEEMNRFRKVIEKRLNIQMGALERPDGTLTEPGKDTLTHLMQTHFQHATELKNTEYDLSLIHI